MSISGCKVSLKNFKERYVEASFTVQIIEYFPGSGYSDNKACPDYREKRLKGEEHWMKTLRTIYPYGLKERAHENNCDTYKLSGTIKRQLILFVLVKNFHSA